LVRLRLKEGRRLFKTAPPLTRILLSVLLFLALNAVAVVLNEVLRRVQMFETGAPLLALVSFGVFLLLFCQAASSIMSFFKDRDSKILLSMPIKENELFFSKIIAMCISEFITNLFVMYPLLLWVGLRDQTYSPANIDLTYFSVMPFMVLLIPLVAVLLAALVSVPLKIITTELGKRPKAGIAAGALVAAGIVTLYMFFVTGFSDTVRVNADLTDIMYQFEAFVQSVHGHLLYFSMLSDFAAGKLFWLVPVILLATIAALSLGLYYVVRPFYFRLAGEGLSAPGLSVGKTGAKPMTRFGALFRKEARMVFRSVGKLTTYFMFAAIAPFALVVYHDMLYAMVATEVADLVATGVFFAVTCVFAMLSCIYSANIVSIEGKNAFYLKTFPVQYRTGLLAKMLFNALLALCSLTLSIVVCFIFFPGNFMRLFLSLLGAAILAVGVVFANSVLDIFLSKPSKGAGRLTLNSAIATFAALVFGIGLGAIHIVLAVSSISETAVWVINFSIVGGIALVAAAAFFVLANSAIRKKEF